MKKKKESLPKINPNNLKKEEELWEKYEYIAGVDEAGRGPFAGPVVAGAAIMPKDLKIEGLTDSKKISKKKHKEFSDLVKKHALAYAIGVVSVEEIDEINNITKSVRLAMTRAVQGLKIKPNYILVDGREKVNLEIEQESIIKGDYNCHCISAAAIIAKVYRDELMEQLDKEFNGVYNWRENAGYQTRNHEKACYEFGLTKYHRKTWKTMELFKGEQKDSE